MCGIYEDAMNATSPITNPKVKDRGDGHKQCQECYGFDFHHYPGCPQLRPFPIQHGGSVPWWIAEVAFEYYHENWPGQSLERISDRGGFGVCELIGLIRREL